MMGFRSSLALCRHIRLTRLPHASRCYSTATDAIPEPAADTSAPKEFPERITTIVDMIADLTLVDVADLNAALKQRLNLPDAPTMPMGGMMMASPAGGGGAAAEESAPAAQTAFTVKLTAFDDKKKIALIKQIKASVGGFNLVQAKKFVEGAPQTVKEDLTKAEAEELKKALEGAGGTITIS